MLSEQRLYNNIPLELEPSWVVSYLEKNRFTSGNFRVLRAKTNISDKMLSSLLNLAPKTFVSYTKDVSKTKVDTKEHVLMLISLLKHGADIFGSDKNFSDWLECANVFFDNRKPLEFLNTICGIKMVDDRLTALEYGDNV